MGTKGKKDWPYPIRSDPDGRPYTGGMYIFDEGKASVKSFNTYHNTEDFIWGDYFIASKDLVEW